MLDALGECDLEVLLTFLKIVGPDCNGDGGGNRPNGLCDLDDVRRSVVIHSGTVETDVAAPPLRNTGARAWDAFFRRRYSRGKSTGQNEERRGSSLTKAGRGLASASPGHRTPP